VQTIPGWEANNVGVVALVSILGNVSTSQVRQDGTDPNHTEELSHSIVTFGQKVPVTVEQVGTDDQGNPTYRLVDGNHRYDAIRKLRKLNPADARWAVIKIFVKKFRNDWERTHYQSEMNAHETPAKLSTTSDAVVTLHNVILNGLQGAPAVVGNLHNSQGRNVTEPGKYAKDLNKAVKLLFPGFSAKQRKSVVRQLQGKRLPGKFGRWTAPEVKEAFIAWADSADMAYDEEFLHTVKNTNYVDWQLLARCFAAKSDAMEGTPYNSVRQRLWEDQQPSCNTVIVFWSDVAGKDNKALNEQRVKIIEKINKRNSSWMLRMFKGMGLVKIVDRILIAPQKRDKGCAEFGFFEVPVNSKGQFSTTLIAKSGWDTESKQAAAK